MKKQGIWSVLGLIAPLIAGCQSVHSPSFPTTTTCVVGKPQQQTTLWFGLSQPNGQQITTQQWQQFVDQQVTPAFREGLTVITAQGQWLGQNGKIAYEQSRGLMLIYAQNSENNQAIETIRLRYKQRFLQEAVMRIDHSVCVDF